MPEVSRWIWGLLKLLAIAGIAALGSCTSARTILQQAPTKLPADFVAERYVPMPTERAKTYMEQTLFGVIPQNSVVDIESRDLLDREALNGKAELVQWRLNIRYGDGPSRPLDMVALFPKTDPNAPLILSQNFCPNVAVVPLDGVRPPSSDNFCSDGGLMSRVMTFFFGRYIASPPLEDIIERGYGFAAIYPSQFVPDRSAAGMETLAALFPDNANHPGALAVWASLFNDMAGIIEADQGARTIYTYGHSRFGKTALIAGAWFDSIDGVIAHQSGTLGASSLTDGTGEPLSSLAESYPHWARADIGRYAYRPEALPVRAADLLHAIKPKPVLLGNARRDVWSDPFGAFTEAKLAFGDDMSAEAPGTFVPTDPYAYWLRPGTHGVVKEDWPAFLDFLDAQTSR